MRTYIVEGDLYWKLHELSQNNSVLDINFEESMHLCVFHYNELIIGKKGLLPFFLEIYHQGSINLL